MTMRPLSLGAGIGCIEASLLKLELGNFCNIWQFCLGGLVLGWSKAKFCTKKRLTAFCDSIVEHANTRLPLTRLQTTFSHCSLTLETTKKRLETRDYKKMRFRRAAAVTFFLGGDAEVLRAGVPHFFLRAARGYVFSLYFGLYHQYYLKSC